MVTRIPDRARMGAPRTPSPNGRAAQTGDLGLGAVGEALARTGRGLQTRADERAKAAFDATDAEDDADYIKAASLYDGREPGFASQQMARYDGRLAATAEAFGDDVDGRRAFERQIPARRVARLDNAIKVESERSAARIEEARARSISVDAVNRTAAFRVAYAGEKRQLLDAYDGSEAGLTTKALLTFDKQMAMALDGAPPEVREALEIQLTAARGDEWMQLQTVEQRAQDVYRVTAATKASETLISAIISDPAAYDQVMKDAEALFVDQPVVLGNQMREDFTRSATVARFGGMLERGQWEAVLTQLDSGDWDDRLGAAGKAQVRDNATRHRAAAGFDPVSVERELERGTMDTRVQSEVASLVATGVSTGLTAAEVRAVGGPVAEAAYARQVEQARLAYSVTRGLAGLPPREQLARVEALKPVPGSPTYAQDQQVYELALRGLDAARTQQIRDPAQATQASPANASLWRRYASQPDRTSATMWASDTLARQEALGTPPGQRRVLPVSEAQRLAGIVKDASGPDVLSALQTVAQTVGTFGPYEGAVLTDLTRAGLSPVDAAVIGQAGDNPLILNDYARARARGNVGLTPTVRRDVRGQVVDRMAPLTATWAALPGGQAGVDALISGVETVAAAYVADGMSTRQAAEAASQAYLDSYTFNGGWRMPRHVAGRRVPVAQILTDERSGNVRSMAVRPGRAERSAPVQVSAVDAAEVGALRYQVDLVAEGGAGLEALGTEPHLTDAQKRARHADTVASRGRWISTLDDSGLMLVVPDASRPGGVIPVHDASGQPIRRTWDELFSRAARPARARGAR